MNTRIWIKRWQTLVVLSLVAMMAMVIVACGEDEEENESLPEMTDSAVLFWSKVAENMPEWNHVKEKHRLAMELRQESLVSHANIIRAIGGLGAELMRDYPDTWEDRLPGLQDINWRRSNPEWEGVCIVAGSISSNRQSRQATKAFIKRSLGLTMSEAEERSLAMDKFDNSDRERVIDAVEERYSVELEKVGQRTKWLRDKSDRNWWIIGGTGLWHGIPEEMLEAELRSPSKEGMIVVAERQRTTIEVFVGPVGQLCKARDQLSRGRGGKEGDYQYHFNCEVTGDRMRIKEVPAVTLKKTISIPN